MTPSFIGFAEDFSGMFILLFISFVFVFLFFLLCIFLVLILICRSGWERRQLFFGKEDGYSQNDLLDYIAANKIIYKLSKNPSDETAKEAMENAAHATVTGVGLLFLAKPKSRCTPVDIINLVHFQVSLSLSNSRVILSQSRFIIMALILRLNSWENMNSVVLILKRQSTGREKSRLALNNQNSLGPLFKRAINTRNTLPWFKNDI
jgi:hypothetical protein